MCLAALAAQNSSVPGQTRPSAPPVRVEPDWRRNLTQMLQQPPANASARDLERFEQYLLAAGPYCASLTPNDYEANRALMRSMATYLATVNTAARDPQLRAAGLRVSRAMAAFPCAYPAARPPSQSPDAAPPPSPSAAPFLLHAPAIENLPDADRETALELQTRYETDAGRAASAWKNAETLHQNLAARGMSLNTQTAASVKRLPLLIDQAATGLREHAWAETRTHLEAAEAETQKIVNAVGR
jgi:hypothetical protein